MATNSNAKQRLEALEAHTAPLGRSPQSAARMYALIHGESVLDATDEERESAAKIFVLLAKGDIHADE
jgi:hypothetical protein